MEKFNHWSSPLGEIKADFPPFIEELAMREQWNIRCHPEDKQFNDLSDILLGERFPENPNSVVQGNGGAKVLWLSPTEWLLVKDKEIGEQIEKIRSITAHLSITDVSANRVILSLTGENARTILSKCCDFDFHPEVFHKSRCAQTLMAKSQAIIECTGENEFHIYVRNSFSRYVAEILIDASREFC
ncbi:sarcosine oxidase subunit gamma [Sneathiella glossodoripedis]|uniref:sarcosine oxidase subunit gamma n=1 Tax=Sneathiella glossodoripedis TaxID=418853 RepID=UPI00046E71A6|nr:sarcosine oxidase subunit gamma family protein [Sneathiella glossodoripedis]